ncbi:hypothetical protein IQ224_16435 [Microcystis sp. LEGE 00066]|nr:MULTISPECIES: hypothetical protein [Microcystis]ARI81657.1 hypothetical protein BH695_2376 [Microcystis aeruginosa PCC 7806SL]ARI82099.1 hypothetical protein BH695_2820 [Microcystis aeruginosa PCC 7806SL]ARI84322.1 hypothetical protein BH695_5043 [Microcystis aeruginosa PCC 7806SL]ELS45282.1 hypothetical protein C789_4906 [Microcystis aeruginosa FACHB-905 = DIANCHI905]MBE9263680.1 hypothetical protein [Microcystis sp. LEGE 00066]
MSQSLQLSQLIQETKTSILSETFSDYGVETILSELIDFVLEEYPDQLHCGILSAYLIPAKNYVAVLNNRENFRLETNYPNFTNVEETNG